MIYKCNNCGKRYTRNYNNCPGCKIGRTIPEIDEHINRPSANAKSIMVIILGTTVAVGVALLIVLYLIFNIAQGNANKGVEIVQQQLEQPSSDNITYSKVQDEADYKNSCSEFNYIEMTRNPDLYKGSRVKTTCRISQVFKEDITYYVAYTESEYGNYYGKQFLIIDSRTNKSTNILEDDIVNIYGEFMGNTVMTRTLSNQNIEVPFIDTYIIDLIGNETDIIYNESNTESNTIISNNKDDSSYDVNEQEYSEDDGLTMEQRNAVKHAQSYLDTMAFSRQGLIEQLEYEGYSNESAVFAVDRLNIDWNEQAAREAQSYLDTMAFSRQGLIEQLEYEGYTHEQAVYGVESVGYTANEEDANNTQEYEKITIDSEEYTIIGSYVDMINYYKNQGLSDEEIYDEFKKMGFGDSDMEKIKAQLNTD